MFKRRQQNIKHYLDAILQKRVAVIKLEHLII